MTQLSLLFLGELAVNRGDEVAVLPPSKKTRALLAYLALHERPFRREQLCELLWEVPDDPRGSLRWSMSKLRRLVDYDARARIVADRSQVAFDAEGVDIDCVSLHLLVNNGLSDCSIDELQCAADRFQGSFLEGLELPDFHLFYAWCLAQREQVVRDQSTLLRALVERLESEPERALDPARALSALVPYEESAHASLIRCLVALDRTQEAEQAYLYGKKLLAEVGVENPAILYRAWRGTPGTRPAVAASVVPVAAPAILPEHELVGRDRELAQLQQSLSQTLATQCAACLLIQGEAGIGKSSLLAVARAAAHEAGALVLESQAYEAEVIRPFALWSDALMRCADIEEPTLFLGDKRIDRELLFAGLSELISARAATAPVVVIFDDLQWCDESSISALHYLLRMNRERPLWVVVGARDTELQENSAALRTLRDLRKDQLLVAMKLERLTEAVLQQLIELHAPTVDSQRLCLECGGNPLMAIELARAESKGEAGGSLDELIQDRLSRFDSQATDTLRWAAVLSPNIDVGSLERATGQDGQALAEVLENAERQGLLKTTDRGFGFSHDLVASAVYASIAPSRRQVMHRHVAERLEVETALDLKRAADLAHHASLSGDPGLGTRAMVLAGRLCLRFYANDEALRLASSGLDLCQQLSDADRVCLTLDLNEIRLNAAPLDDWEAAATEYVALAEQALDHGALPYARLGYHMASYLRWVHGQWSDAQRESLQAERVTRGGTDEEHIIGMAEAAKCLAMLERDLTQADAMLMEASSLAERKRVSAACIPAASGMLRYYEGKHDEAEELLEDARARSKSAGDRISEYQANEYLVMIDIERGEFAPARDRCQRLLEIGEKLREGSEGPFAHALVALCHYALEGKGSLQTELDSLRQVDAKQRLAYILNRAAQIDLQRENVKQAALRATEALEYASLLARKSEMMLARVALARVARARDDRTEYDHQCEAMAELESGTGARWARELAAPFLQSHKRGTSHE
ncbi:MAG: AAA family ATPase [Halioglobus sp.]